MRTVPPVREIPCGNCNCGTYSIGAMLNPKARTLGALPEEERLKAIPRCKKDPELLCAGDMDYHLALIKLDENISSYMDKPL